MKADILSLEGQKVKSVDLPDQFSEAYEPVIIKRAVMVVEANSRQPYGAMEEAGEGVSAKLSRRRRDYKGSYGKGMSRAPRKTMSRTGVQFNWVGAFAPGTRGGRRANPPKSWKNWSLKINIQERKKAIRSALAGLVDFKKLLVVDSRVQDVSKTKDFKSFLEAVKLGESLERCEDLKVRAGRGKSRGRKYKSKQGPLIVVGKKCNLAKVINGVKGFDIVTVESLNAKVLTSGHDKPRQTIWSEEALERLGKEKLFMRK
jgi:large subunit ribosomal protein L4e